MLTRLRHLGAHVIESEYDRVGDRLVAGLCRPQAEEPAVTAFVDAACRWSTPRRFRAAHEADWERLDRIVTAIEKRGVRGVPEQALLVLPVLYRSALSSLSVARETSLDQSAGRLSRAAVHARLFPDLRRADLAAGASSAISSRAAGRRRCRRCGSETLVAFVLTVAGAIVAYLLVRNDPSWYLRDHARRHRRRAAIRPRARESLRATHLRRRRGQQQSALAIFATFLFTHNAQIAIFAFALGFAFCRADRAADRL